MTTSLKTGLANAVVDMPEGRRPYNRLRQQESVRIAGDMTSTENRHRLSTSGVTTVVNMWMSMLTRQGMDPLAPRGMRGGRHLV